MITVASASELKSPTQTIGKVVVPGPARNSAACACWASPEIGSRWVGRTERGPLSVASTDAHAHGSETGTPMTVGMVRNAAYWPPWRSSASGPPTSGRG